MLRRGYRVINVPTHEYSRKFGTSHINIWKEWPYFIWVVLINLIYFGPAVSTNRNHQNTLR